MCRIKDFEDLIKREQLLTQNPPTIFTFPTAFSTTTEQLTTVYSVGQSDQKQESQKKNNAELEPSSR